MDKTLVNPPTIADVAAEAGVSIATVSRVLNNRTDVARGTRQRVQAVIERLGYNGGAAAKQKAKQGLKYLSLMAHTVDNEYWGEIIRGITDELDPIAHQVTLHLTGAEAKREESCLRINKQTGSDGLLIVNPQTPEESLASLIGDQLPYVLIDYYAEQPAIPCVRATNWQGVRQATDYLLSLGHRRIGVISGRESDKVVIARNHGYHSALLEAEVLVDPALIVPGDYSWASGYQAMMRLLNLAERPTAVLAFSDRMAMGAVEAIHVAGLQIPGDISMIGFDNVPTIRQLHPPLTTIHQPLYEMGRMAAQMLVTLVNGETLVSPQLVLPTQLIERESCRSIL